MLSELQCILKLTKSLERNTEFKQVGLLSLMRFHDLAIIVFVIHPFSERFSTTLPTAISGVIFFREIA